MRLDIQLTKLMSSALEAWVQEDERRKGWLNYDDELYTPAFRKVFDTQHRPLLGRLAALKKLPECLVIVNAGKPERWQSLWSVWIPLLGELTGFSKISSTMYNNSTSSRLRDLRVRFAGGAPEGAVVDIEEDPWWRTLQKHFLTSTDSQMQERYWAAHHYFDPLLQPYEGPPVTDRHKRAGDDRHKGASFRWGKRASRRGQECRALPPFATFALAAAGGSFGARYDCPSRTRQ